MEHKIKIKGKEYPVWFRHEMDYERFHPHTGNLIIHGRTVAYVELEKEVVEAYAECSVLDPYSKKRGRTVAEGRLKMALTSAEKMVKYMEHEPPKVEIKPLED